MEKNAEEKVIFVYWWKKKNGDGKLKKTTPDRLKKSSEISVCGKPVYISEIWIKEKYKDSETGFTHEGTERQITREKAQSLSFPFLAIAGMMKSLR